MSRRSRTRTHSVAVAAAAVSALALAAQALPAQAGEVAPPYFVYSDAELPPGGQLTSVVIAQRVDRPARAAVPLSGGTVPSYAPSVSRDGRVLAFVRVRNMNDESSARLIISVDGRTVLRTKDAGSMMAVTPDGSAVTWVGPDGSVQMYRVATGDQVTLCDDCAPGGSYAALSPDGRKLALRVRAGMSGTSRVVIRRLSDLRVLARTDADDQLIDGTIAWRPDSRQVAYSDQRFTKDLKIDYVITTVTTRGEIGRTAFDSRREPAGEGVVTVYAAPAWVNGAVWAARLDVIAPDRVRVVAVTAATWQDTPVAGATMRVVPTVTAFITALGSWATTSPATTLGSGVGCIPPRFCTAVR